MLRNCVGPTSGWERLTQNTAVGRNISRFPAPAGDDQFCPLDGHIFTRSEVEYISQEHVDAGKVVHESTVSANSVCSEEVVGDSSSLHTPLVEEYVVSIGEHVLL